MVLIFSLPLIAGSLCLPCALPDGLPTSWASTVLCPIIVGFKLAVFLLSQVPYISDPNTGVEMFESAEIVKYLLDTYTVKK